MNDACQTCGGPDAAASERLNRACFCVTLDRDALDRSLAAEAGAPDVRDAIARLRPHLFARVPLFLPAADAARMEAVVAAIEAAARLPAYVDAALARAPGIARGDPGPVGAFMGYDFHLGADGPKLIEVNTNAGGAFLNALLARAQAACCPEAENTVGKAQALAFEDEVARMFVEEWVRQRGTGRPRRIAIVDDAPEEQYLHPEFLIAARMLRRQGFDATVADAGDLDFRDGRLLAHGEPVDLVYNRLVDFALAEPRHAALRAAYAAGAAVVTPNPHVHALFADKRNLIPLSDPDLLRAWGLDEAAVAALAAAVPRTVAVTPDTADALWADRRRLFFKPAAGHGSKAAYRGDKLTKGVWAEIAKGGHVAQAYAPPGERTVIVDGTATPLKADVRLYTYAGRTLLLAARLYQGQTTNFRTPGGGFAPVFQV